MKVIYQDTRVKKSEIRCIMVADFVLVIASLPALIPKHMRLIIPVVLLVWIV